MKKTIQIIITVDVEESKIGKYIIPRSNFSTGKPNEAYVLGIPCKILSEPYIINHKNVLGVFEDEEVYDVQSMVTGIRYTIPTGWADEYDTLEEANKHAHIEGIENPFIENIIGMKYWPRSNSFNEDSNGEWHNIFKKECVVISAPFKDRTHDKYFDRMFDSPRKFNFIKVKCNGKVHRVLFEEWALIDPK